MLRRRFRPAEKPEKVPGYQVALTFDGEIKDRDAHVRAIDANPKIKTKRNGKVTHERSRHDDKDVVTFTVDTEEEANALVAALQEQFPGKTIHSGALGVEIPPDPIPIEETAATGAETKPDGRNGRLLGDADKQFGDDSNVIVHTLNGNQPTWMHQILGGDASPVVFAQFDTGARADHNSVSKGTPNKLTLIDCTGGAPVRTEVPNSATQSARKKFSDDVNGHGTHVLADALRFVPNAEVLSFKVLGDNGHGSFYAIEAALDELSKELHSRKRKGDHRKVVLNASLSWLPSFAPPGFNVRIQQKINKLNAEFGDRFIMVVAAGNHGMDIDKESIYPASFNGVVTVGAFTPDLLQANFSNRGRNVIGVVGDDVVSASNRGAVDAESIQSGTSMSAPSLAGMMANLWQLMPGLTAGELTRLVKDLAIDPDKTRFVNYLAGGNDPDTNMYAQTLPIVNLEINRVLEYINSKGLKSKCAPGVFERMQQLAPEYQVRGIPVTGTKQHFLMRNDKPKPFNSGDTVSYQITVGPCRASQSLTIAAASQAMVGSDGIQDMVDLITYSDRSIRVVPGQILMAPITMKLPVSTSNRSYTVTITRNRDTPAGQEGAVIKVFDESGSDITTTVIPEQNSRKPRLFGGMSVGPAITKCKIDDLKLQITRSSGVEVLGFETDVVAPAPAPTATDAPTARATTSAPTERPSLLPTTKRPTRAPTGRPSLPPTKPVTVAPTAATPQPTIATPNPTLATPAPTTEYEYEQEYEYKKDPATAAPTPAPVTFSPTAATGRPTKRGGKGKPTRRPTRRGTVTGAPTGPVTEPPTPQEEYEKTGTPTAGPTPMPSAMPTTAMPTTAPTPDLFATPVTLTHGNCGLFTITERIRNLYVVDRNIMFKVGVYQFIITPNSAKNFNIRCLTPTGAEVSSANFDLDGINQLEAIKISNNNNQLTIGIFKQFQAKAQPLLGLTNEQANQFDVRLPKTYGARRIGVDDCRERIERIERGLQESIHGVDPDLTREAGLPSIEQLRRDRLPGHGSGELPGSSVHQDEFTPQTPRPDFPGLLALGATVLGFMWRKRIQAALAKARARIPSDGVANEPDPEQPMLVVIGKESDIDKVAKPLAEIYRPESTGTASAPKTP